MKLNSILKSIAIIFFIIFNQQTLASTSKNILNVTGCSGSGNLCTDVAEMEAYARDKVRQHTEEKSGQGKYDFIMQSDAIDEAYLFEFEYIDKRLFIEGPNGSDIIYKPFVKLISQKRLFGDRKARIELLVSAKYVAEKVTQNNPSAIRADEAGSLNSIDYDSFCSTTANPQRRPSNMTSQCLVALWDAGLWNDVNVIERTLVLVGSQGVIYTEGSMNAAVTELKAGMSVTENTEKVKEFTISFGSPIRVTTNDGYTLLLSPTRSGIVKAMMFLMPPNDQELPIDEKGSLLLDKITEKAKNGGYVFNRDNLNFVNIMANRTGLSAWRKLSDMIINGGSCEHCTITDLGEIFQK
jgi:hypothetical protein